jgi:hypothetical protein
MEHMAANQGVKLTTTGNFNRKFVEQMVRDFRWPGFEPDVVWRFNKVLNEPDYAPLDFLHALIDLAGLGRKHKGTFRLSRGKPKIWACGALYALGQVSFLSDKSFEPYLTLGKLCDLMGVGKSTASAKARLISEASGPHQFHPEWTLPSILEQDPSAWFIEINGLLADARRLPVEIQEAAVQEGLIPYVPGSQERRILVDRYLQLREISTHHQTLLARRAIKNKATDIAVRIGLVEDGKKVGSMELGDLAPALDIALFSKGPDGMSLADRYLKEVGARLDPVAASSTSRSGRLAFDIPLAVAKLRQLVPSTLPVHPGVQAAIDRGDPRLIWRQN